MNILQEVYFEIGKLNIQLKNIKKSYFLLPMIARQGVLSLNCRSKKIEFESLFAPNVADNPSKEVMIIVKSIKTINDVISNGDLDIKSIKKIVSSFDKSANLAQLDDVEFSFDFHCLYNIYNAIYVKNNELSALTFSVICNVFMVLGKYLPLPIFDIAKAIVENDKAKTSDEFFGILLKAINHTTDILAKHKKMVKEHTLIAQKANMKSVVAEYNYLLENPVIEVGSMLEELQMTFATLSKATAILENNKILTKIAGSQRYRIFKYDALCTLFSN